MFGLVGGGKMIGFGLYQFWRNMGKVGVVLGEESGWAAWAMVCEDGMVLCLCGVLCILGAPSVQSCCTLSIYAS